MNSLVQIHSAGNRVLPNATRATFWRLTLGGRVVGWAIGYQAAIARAERIEHEHGQKQGAALLVAA